MIEDTETLERKLKAATIKLNDIITMNKIITEENNIKDLAINKKYDELDELLSVFSIEMNAYNDETLIRKDDREFHLLLVSNQIESLKVDKKRYYK